MPRSAPHFVSRAFAPLHSVLLLAAAMSVGALLHSGEPVEPQSFKHARITDAWEKYAKLLTFGKGQTLALVDDGCTLSMPEWSKGYSLTLFDTGVNVLL